MIICATALLTACGSDVTPAGTTLEQTEAADSCPPPDAAGNSAIDWVPFVRVDGISYHATMPESMVAEAALGEIVSTVSCQISDLVGNPEYEIRDGDAAYLPAGTELREVLGYRTDFRLAAREGTTWTIYESYNRDDVTIAEDMLDLRTSAAKRPARSRRCSSASTSSTARPFSARGMSKQESSPLTSRRRPS